MADVNREDRFTGSTQIAGTPVLANIDASHHTIGDADGAQHRPYDTLQYEANLPQSRFSGCSEMLSPRGRDSE